MRAKKAMATVAMVLLAAGSGVTHAQTQTAPGNELTAAQILQKLEAQGYTNIDDLERDGAHWEVEATRPDGTRVELHLSATDGRIIREERDND